MQVNLLTKQCQRDIATGESFTLYNPSKTLNQWRTSLRLAWKPCKNAKFTTNTNLGPPPPPCARLLYLPFFVSTPFPATFHPKKTLFGEREWRKPCYSRWIARHSLGEKPTFWTLSRTTRSCNNRGRCRFVSWCRPHEYSESRIDSHRRVVTRPSVHEPFDGEVHCLINVKTVHEEVDLSRDIGHILKVESKVHGDSGLFVASAECVWTRRILKLNYDKKHQNAK